MSALRALLLFPLRPADASRTLRGRRVALLTPLAVAGLGAGATLLLGCRLAHAAVTGASMLLVALALGAGGWLASFAGRGISGLPVRARGSAAVCLVFGAWTTLLFPLLLIGGYAGGAGTLSGLVAALVLLVWGVAAGLGVLDPEESVEPGRRLVGACVGLSGALAGLAAAMLLVQAWVMVPVPVTRDEEDLRRGDVLLVDRTSGGPRGRAFLRLGPDGPEAVDRSPPER